MEFLLATTAAIPKPSNVSLEKDALAAVWVVGSVALLVIAYLAIDWLRARREARKLELKKRIARETWQAELRKTTSG